MSDKVSKFESALNTSFCGAIGGTCAYESIKDIINSESIYSTAFNSATLAMGTGLVILAGWALKDLIKKAEPTASPE